MSVRYFSSLILAVFFSAMTAAALPSQRTGADISSVAELTASDGAQGNQFGNFTGMSGSTIVVVPGRSTSL